MIGQTNEVLQNSRAAYENKSFDSLIWIFFLCVPAFKYDDHLCLRSLYILPDMYVKDIQSGICAKDGEPVVEKESAGTALVDGKNLLGPVVGNFCMQLAIKKAKEAGIGWVVAHGESGHAENCCCNRL